MKLKYENCGWLWSAVREALSLGNCESTVRAELEEAIDESDLPHEDHDESCGGDNGDLSPLEQRIRRSPQILRTALVTWTSSAGRSRSKHGSLEDENVSETDHSILRAEDARLAIYTFPTEVSIRN